MGKCRECHYPVWVNAGNAYSKICKECWKIRNSQRLGYCYVLEFEGGVYKIGHTVNLDKTLQAYTSATKVAWYAKAPVDICRNISQRILLETSSARTPRVRIPYEYGSNPKDKDVAESRSSAKANYVPKFALVICIKCVPGVRPYWQKKFLSQSLTLHQIHLKLALPTAMVHR